MFVTTYSVSHYLIRGHLTISKDSLEKKTYPKVSIPLEDLEISIHLFTEHVKEY
jgi:hypothetical protein